MHLFAVIVWLGGLMFQNAVVNPVAEQEHEYLRAAIRKMNQRFIGIVWMSAWTILVTGVLMMLMSPRFVWFRYDDRWSVLLGLKQIVFLLMVVYAFGHSRMAQYLGMPASNGGFDEKAELYRHRVHQYRTIMIALGIAAVLLAAGMS